MTDKDVGTFPIKVLLRDDKFLDSFNQTTEIFNIEITKPVIEKKEEKPKVKFVPTFK